jgi:hypothetical protein
MRWVSFYCFGGLRMTVTVERVRVVRWGRDERGEYAVVDPLKPGWELGLPTVRKKELHQSRREAERDAARELMTWKAHW